MVGWVREFAGTHGDEAGDELSGEWSASGMVAAGSCIHWTVIKTSFAIST